MRDDSTFKCFIDLVFFFLVFCFLFWRFGDDNIHTTSTTIIWKSTPPSDFARLAITTSFWTRSFSLSFLFSQLYRFPCLCLSFSLSSHCSHTLLIPFHVSFVHSCMIRVDMCGAHVCVRHVRCGAALDYAQHIIWPHLNEFQKQRQIIMELICGYIIIIRVYLYKLERTNR